MSSNIGLSPDSRVRVRTVSAGEAVGTVCVGSPSLCVTCCMAAGHHAFAHYVLRLFKVLPTNAPKRITSSVFGRAFTIRTLLLGEPSPADLDPHHMSAFKCCRATVSAVLQLRSV
ncbi:hypothetical protein CRENBAI_016831 [Crenichthys baileyi]|uniref:Uncharacterized protein n=1 Tax=Crenichthys baileyi TaxID=28760 RepID=A0AAV9RF74_9TELE